MSSAAHPSAALFNLPLAHSQLGPAWYLDCSPEGRLENLPHALAVFWNVLEVPSSEVTGSRARRWRPAVRLRLLLTYLPFWHRARLLGPQDSAPLAVLLSLCRSLASSADGAISIPESVELL